ncbi:MAG: hydantoinase/oxoprolinase N-terminal domain-containing protein, partial [Alphaproteobacteria bacterium]|nr:hydantoinase/oxoprolinase N-terminal domain-containing protein [Alphaproteobacteria bacterium]
MEIHLGIDVGGTFTDIALSIPATNQLLLHKLPSTPE